jgi:hypothetical protein
MNSSAFRLFLFLLWFVPGVGFLVFDLLNGQVTVLPIRGWRVPIEIPFFIMATLNYARWRMSRSQLPATPPTLRRRLRRPGSEGEPDPAFRFEEPPDAKP